MIGCGMDVQHVGCSKQSRRCNVRFLTIYHSLMRNSSVDSFRGINMRSEKFIKTLYEPTWATFISSYFHILHFMSKELVISYIIRQNGVMNYWEKIAVKSETVSVAHGGSHCRCRFDRSFRASRYLLSMRDWWKLKSDLIFRQPSLTCLVGW